MRAPHHPARLRALAAAPLALALVLGGCNNDPSPATPQVTFTTAPTPTPTGTQSGTSLNVSGCLSQVIPGTNGATPASLVIPDTVKLDPSRPSGFPNGRLLSDPVVDVTLAVLFLNVNAPGQSAATLAGVPVNPNANFKPTSPSVFPFLASPAGTPPLASGTGTGFNFRTDPESAYVRVDRMGQPAVATVVIGSARKTAYNDASTIDDASGLFVPEITQTLAGLATALADDFAGLKLATCAK